MGSARDTVTRPLAVGITTLGLAGLLLTAAPTLLLGIGGAASSGAAPPEVANLAASPTPDDRTPAALAGDNTEHATTAEADTGPSPTLTLSVGLLVVGGGLFAARRLAVHGRPMR